MVLESLISISKIKMHPFIIFPITFLCTSMSLYFAYWIFPMYSSIIFILFCNFLMLPLFYKLVRAEKRKEEKVKNYLEQLLKTNSQIFLFFIWAFLGFTLAVATWYVVLPQNITRLLFEAQLTTIREINAVITGGLAAKSFFYAILTNNFKVLIFTLLFAFIFGPGVLFILTWNASVIGVAIGERIKFSILANPMVTGGSAVAHYTNIVSFGLVRYLIHGSLEVLAYFISAIAGMMLSLAVLETKQNTYLFKKTLCDVILLICFASIILILAGIIEVGINALFV